MKILRGNLTETRFKFPDPAGEKAPMKVISKKTYKENQVAYMADELGLHRVTNEGSDFAVSLHCEKPLTEKKTLAFRETNQLSQYTLLQMWLGEVVISLTSKLVVEATSRAANTSQYMADSSRKESLDNENHDWK